MERAGARPHIVTHDDIPEGYPETRERGWTWEVVAPPRGTRRDRLRQHIRSEVAQHSPLMARRLRALAREVAFAQFEEVESVQYVAAVPRALPTVASLYNVDSQVQRDMLRVDGNAADWRKRYRVKRMEIGERRAVRRADVVIAVSEHDGQEFALRGARRTMVVPNGVDDALFSIPSEPARSERVLFFGQFGWAPNRAGLLRYLEEAWPTVAAARPAAELRILGPGSDSVRPVVTAYERVQVVGFVDDLAAELASTRVVIAPLWVGGGTRLKVLEALAAARPVVGTSVGVERIGFERDRHGLISDTAEGLAEATITVLSDNARASRYALAGRQLASEYRWDAVTASAEVLYRKWLDDRRLGSSRATRSTTS
jgi:hypothetical protein